MAASGASASVPWAARASGPVGKRCWEARVCLDGPGPPRVSPAAAAASLGSRPAEAAGAAPVAPPKTRKARLSMAVAEWNARPWGQKSPRGGICFHALLPQSSTCRSS
eukprot:scaffold5015_cov92-Isochrysis_galbana.AAC.2